jgi:CheY-like chemotaxis protein
VLHLSTSDFMVGRDNPPSVLVIDDDPDMRQVLSDFLQRSGYRVVEAANGQEGIFAAECEPIDAVILDKEMPGMNGLDVLPASLPALADHLHHGVRRA